MNSRQLKYLRKQRAAVRQLREALDDLPPLAWTTLAQVCASEGHSLEELYKFLDSLDEHLSETLVDAARKKAP